MNTDDLFGGPPTDTDTDEPATTNVVPMRPRRQEDMSLEELTALEVKRARARRAARELVEAEQQPGDNELLDNELARQRAMREARRRLDAEEDEARPKLAISSVGDIRAAVRARGPRKWLIEGLWIESTAMVFGAQEKFGKTVGMVDFLVSVASGTPWLGLLPVAQRGEVLGFFAEDDDAEILRRLDAVCAARGLKADALPIRLCFSAPNLSSEDSLEEIRAEVRAHRPVVAMLDPLYLSIGELGDSSNLYKMGMVLNAFKAVCAETRTAPGIITHWNKTGVGTGSSRLTGTGTTQWARTIVSGSVENVDVAHVPATLADGTEVVQKRVTTDLSLEFTGNSIAPTTVKVRRKMWAENPLDLDSPLHYEVGPVAAREQVDTPAHDGSVAPLSAGGRSLAVLTRLNEWMSAADIQEADARARPVGRDGSQMSPMKVDTVSKACRGLAERGKLAKQIAADGQTVEYRLPDPVSAPDGADTAACPFRHGNGLGGGGRAAVNFDDLPG